ncbi:MAG: ATP-binding protein [Deltaproteobacteria bacterium]|nr:ATP-binding protein [Nannocystaceae bacterium]
MTELERAFGARSVVWLAGVRRSGKTTLVRALENASYHDCELVRVRRALEDPELFFRNASARTIVLDEVHRLANPSEVLKIAADHFPDLRVVATGSSTLAARDKFRDTLTGRKRDVWLVPMISADLADFGSDDLDRRMLRGGLPPFFLPARLDEAGYEEWISSYWAKDLSELFVVEKKAAFMKMVELVFTQSGGRFETQSIATACEVARPTVQHWLTILETTLLASVIRPYHGGKAAEIKAQPKVYAFDTGFVAYFQGLDALRDEDRGQLLEHLVLGEIAARFGTQRLHYWRDKQNHEVDFVLELGRRRELLALECKSSAARFDPAGLLAFRGKHPRGRNLVVTLRATEAYRKTFGAVEVEFVPHLDLAALLDELR